MRRATAVFCCLWFGLLPWQVYEDRCHYAPKTWRAHAAPNPDDHFNTPLGA